MSRELLQHCNDWQDEFLMKANATSALLQGANSHHDRLTRHRGARSILLSLRVTASGGRDDYLNETIMQSGCVMAKRNRLGCGIEIQETVRERCIGLAIPQPWITLPYGLDLKIGYAQRFTTGADNFFRVVVETEFGGRGER